MYVFVLFVCAVACCARCYLFFCLSADFFARMHGLTSSRAELDARGRGCIPTDLQCAPQYERSAAGQNICIYIHICIYVYIYVCIYIYIYIYIYVYTNIDI